VALSVPCPRCAKPIVADEEKPLPPAFPFCSERCRLIDLGKWFDEEYRIAGRRERSDGSTPDEA
jgi:endogenous inhibitor of DNA gyrase (YacG/DUF329 family)